MLEGKGLSFAYGGQSAVRDADITVQAGKLTCLIGPNGSGKSTLLSLLGGLLKPKSGCITLNGKPLSLFSRRELAQSLAFVPQSAQTAFDFTVREIVLMGRSPYLKPLERPNRADEQAAERALDRMGLSALSDRPATDLSGGEWQRVLIARALCQDTPVLLLDEPTASLDIAYQLSVLKLLRELSLEGRAVALVLHTLPLALHYADTLYLMHKGRLIASGTPQNVLTEDNLLSVYGIHGNIVDLPNGMQEFVPKYP